jgi:hypothetical protein
MKASEQYRQHHGKNVSDVAWQKAEEYLAFCDAYGSSLPDLATFIQEAINKSNPTGDISYKDNRNIPEDKSINIPA